MTGNPGDLVDVPPVADPVSVELFAAAGHQLYLVGGPVRDGLMGRPVNDLDFTTDARPEQVLAAGVGPGLGHLDHRHRLTARSAPRCGGEPCEITTFRADRYDRVSRNPVVDFGTDIADDLRRRDFTMNAMAVSVADRPFVDPYGGLADLARGLLRTPAPPQESFGDDPLRMLRAARFVAQLGVTPAEPVTDAIRQLARELARITAERVQAELNKLMLGAYPRRGPGAAGRHRPGRRGAARAAGAADGRRRARPAQGRLRPHPAGARSGHRAWSSRPAQPDLVLRWAALLHDIGKPATRRFDGPGGEQVTFHHHEVVGARLTKARLKALKFPKDQIDDIARLVFLHLRFYGYGRGRVDRLGRPPLRHRRRPAAGPAAQAGPLGHHHPQQAQGRAAGRHLRRPGGADRPAARAGGARRDPAGPGRQRDHGDPGPCRPGRWSARPTSTCWSCGWSTARCRTTRPCGPCGRGTPSSSESGPGRRQRDERRWS